MAKQFAFILVLMALACCNGSPERATKQEQAAIPTSVVFPGEVDPGVALELAEARKAAISNINYDLTFHVPDRQSEIQDINGVQSLTFDLV